MASFFRELRPWRKQTQGKTNKKTEISIIALCHDHGYDGGQWRLRRGNIRTWLFLMIGMSGKGPWESYILCNPRWVEKELEELGVGLRTHSDRNRSENDMRWEQLRCGQGTCRLKLWAKSEARGILGTWMELHPVEPCFFMFQVQPILLSRLKRGKWNSLTQNPSPSSSLPLRTHFLLLPSLLPSFIFGLDF